MHGGMVVRKLILFCDY